MVIKTKIKLDRGMIGRAKKLKFIGRLGSGIDHIDTSFAEQHGIPVLRTPEGLSQSVAEHAIGMILAFYHNLRQADYAVRTFNWNREVLRGEEISNKQLGIVGYGNTGSALAAKMKGFSVNILVYDPYLDLSESQELHQLDHFEDLLEQAEIVSFHVPLTEETHHMLNPGTLSLCGPDTLIVNTSRGKVIDTSALVSKLENGALRGACLDVFENESGRYDDEEKTMYERMVKLDNVWLSPHVAGWSVQSNFKMSLLLAEKIKANIHFE